MTMSCTGTCHSHINLTTRGKLLLIDVEKAKRDEFNRRRKIRLQQVRQQSNQIAKEIRDKVKAEKTLKCSQYEIKKQAHFEKWKENQIKTLQDEFNRRAQLAEQDKENALKEAELADLEKERQQVLEEIAKKRGNLAVLKQRRDKLNDETESFLKTSNAKFNRSLENLRSALISSLPKPDAKKTQPENMPGSEKRFLSPGKISPRDSEGIFDKVSEESDASIMRVIRGDSCTKRSEGVNSASGRQTSASCQSSSSFSSRFDALSPERISRQKSWSYSPEKRHCGDNHGSPKRPESDCWSSSNKESLHPAQHSYSRRDRHAERKTKVSFQPCLTPSDKQFSFQIPSSPSKRTAGSVLMSPSKRVASSLSQCSHSKDSSPVRCDESYSPNKYKDELDHSDVNRFRSRHVRFEDATSLDYSNHFDCPLGRRSRAYSEGDSEIQSDSDLTWPPRNWNKRQEEDVILYDHCGRTTSRYQPKHTVSVINHQGDDEGLEEEMEACREKALRRHEETLRERRGCRAMYRQRLRAEFSCMISDLANLDKQTRLAKLDSEAKAALIPKKTKKRISVTAHDKSTKDTCKEDPPGRSVVMDCVDDMDLNDNDKKYSAEITRQDLMDCNLDALDQLLARLKEQRDHLIACQDKQEGSQEQQPQRVQSTSVQCSVPPATDSSTSPRAASPERVISHQQKPNKESRATSPILLENCLEEPVLMSKDISSPDEPSKPLEESIQVQTSSKLVRQNNEKQKGKEIDKMFSDKNAESTLNDSNQVSPVKTTDESSSGLSLDASSYSFDGVKVEVKVSKNKFKKSDKRVKLKTDSAVEQKNDGKVANGEAVTTGVFNKIDSWAKKLAENSSSTGTSYMSPPEELNPDEHKLLITVLEGMDKKNSNPILGMYIQKLLSMSKGSLENMSVSISDDSLRSETFKSCFDNVGESSRAQDVSQASSFLTAQSHGVFSQPKESKSILSKPSDKQKSEADDKGSRCVKLIIDSDDSSLTNKGDLHNTTHGAGDSVLMQPDNFAESALYFDALSKYNERLRLLTKMMTEEVLPQPQVQQPRKSFSENDTSYLAVPSDLSGSVKLTESVQEVGLTLPEESYISDGKDDIYRSDFPLTSSWGIRANILPRPDAFHERNTDRRQKPPSTINNHHSRKVDLEKMPPHELSTIVEADSKIVSSLPGSRENQPSTSTERGHLISKTPDSGEDKSKSEEGSYHTLPPTGFPISSESSLISSGNVSPVKAANESSLQILTELPDSSFDHSSAEEVAVSEVFRSLGIGWALSTWRKTHEATRKIEESSSSSVPSDISLGRKKVDEMRCRHSTPIKISEAEKNPKMSDSDDSRLTPPSVTLYQRYQNLIRSPSLSSTLNES